MSLNRKRFLQQMAIMAAAAALPMDAMAKTLQSASNSGNKKSQDRLVDLLLLHTNDLHSRIEPFPANHPMAGKGGIANLATTCCY
jgi:2',3'-cyclic-nucleotide 2'-phosphodiesterase (5'-nucleotidase family)